MRELSSLRVSIIRLLLLLMCIFPSFSTAKASEEYKNEEHGFTFSIPDGWMKGNPNSANNDAAVSLYFPGTFFKEFLWVEVNSAKARMIAEFPTNAFPEHYQEHLKKLSAGLVFSPPEQTEVAGCKAWKLGSEMNRLGTIYRTKTWLTIHRRQLYCITWTDNPDKSHPTDVEQILSSFKFTADENGDEEYRNAAKGFSFTIPAGWYKGNRAQSGISDVFIYRPGDGVRENFKVGVELVHEPVISTFALDLYPKQVQNIARKSIPNAQVEPAKRAVVAGNSAWVFKYKLQKDGKDILSTSWQVLVGEYIYVFEWLSSPGNSHQEAVDKMISSMKFTPIVSNDVGVVEGNKYKNVDKGFSFIIPEGWDRRDPEDPGKTAVTILAPGTARYDLNVDVNALQKRQADSFATADYSRLFKSEIRRAIPDAQVKSEERMTIAGQPAWRFNFEYKLKGDNLRATLWQVLNGGRIYTITYKDTPTATVPKEVDEVIKSFRFISR